MFSFVSFLRNNEPGYRQGPGFWIPKINCNTVFEVRGITNVTGFRELIHILGMKAGTSYPISED